ncbi:MAG TPA: methyl-accepting chemotaxis protein [Candidatus Thioglobus sp.]|nr:methyl-accepting chemotaxis protein [Candidatus Thioglobus sp.]
MKLKIISIVFFVVLFSVLPQVYADLEVSTNAKVYTTNHNLQVFGEGISNENLILRLFAPDGTIAKFDQSIANSDGIFNYNLLTWPEPSTDFPYGTYQVEVISTEQNGLSQKIDIIFAESTILSQIATQRHITTSVFAPETAAINQTMRVFVQTTSDGLLIGNNAKELLGTTHVHLPSGQSLKLTDSLDILHQGLYYIDFTPKQKGTHVFHVIAYTQGTVSHGSAATTVLTQDLGGISNQIITLNDILDETSTELDTLKSEISGFAIILDSASSDIAENTSVMSDSVVAISEASLQMNALLFPIIASIGVIVALQITIIARNR